MDWLVSRLVVGSLFPIPFLLASVNSCSEMGHRDLMERDEFSGRMTFISRCEGR